MKTRLDYLRDCSELYVKGINVLFIIFAIIIIGLGSFLIANAGATLSAIELQSPAVGTLVFGVFLLIFAVIGFEGARRENMWCLGIYAVGSGFMTFSIMAAGAALLSYTGFLTNIQEINLQFELEETIIAYELAIFNDCCAIPFSLEPPKNCDPVNPIFPCIDNPDVYATFLDLVGNTTCSLLEGIQLENGPAVGNPEDGGCGGGSDDQFVQDLAELVEGYLTAIGAGNIVLSIFMLALTLAVCHMLFQEEAEEDKANYE